MSQYSFATTPSIKFGRTKIPMNHVHKTTMNVGDLVPVYCREVLPGDSFVMDEEFVSYLTSSFLKVPLDNLFMDVNFFYVPNRVIWSEWVNLMGENTTGYWTPASSTRLVPSCGFISSTGDTTLTLSDYLGILPNAVDSSKAYSQLPFRAFAKIWNDWYRNENTQAPVLYDGTSLNGMQNINTGNWGPSNIFGKPPKVSKFHDYFTSCLPQPQKGDAVQLPLTGTSPVLTSSTRLVTGTHAGMSLSNVNGGRPTAISPLGANGNVVSFASSGGFSSGAAAYPDNLYVGAVGLENATVNDVRMAFALQRMLERDAVGGTRYTEMLETQYGVRNPDLRLQRSEYLGGSRVPINFQYVPQTSQGTEDSPQANLSAYSHSGGSASFVKSFGEFGYVLGIACIRQKHTYSQGIDRMWTRRSRLDFYNPAFAHIGEQPVYSYQLFASAPHSNIFGYQEAWAEYRYDPDRVSGYMRPGVTGGLAQWSFADDYSNTPSLNSDFLNETSAFVDRTLSVPSSSTPNFLVDFYFKVQCTRVLPLNSTPGLVDHLGNR